MKDFEEYFIRNIPTIKSFHPYYNEALSYIIKNSGKHFRPKLMLSIVKEYEPLLLESSYKVAMALELFHTYSLIHDDLPAMDNASLRRGKATLHTIYNDAIAILIGDGLNTYAFELISTSAFRDDVKVELIKILSTNGGLSGMVLGQAIDLEFEKKPLSLSEVEIMHLNKTAKLIAASLLMGAVIVDLDKDTKDKLYQFGLDLGLLFQVQDDIIDATLSESEAGKPTGLDGDKNSFVNILGLNGAIEYANSLAKKIEDEFSNLDLKLQNALKEILEKYLYRHERK
ncbi:MAG: polyprenyl synthetase family protein [Epsilonproteobacteria bacterium]|nr:polyprenyl synthetase family protein [Campylobacterota bacterium]